MNCVWHMKYIPANHTNTDRTAIAISKPPIIFTNIMFSYPLIRHVPYNDYINGLILSRVYAIHIRA
jgi:hypothetical protein